MGHFNDDDDDHEDNISAPHLEEQNLEDATQEEESQSQEETTGWRFGNPSNMTDIPFTGAPGLLPPHQMEGKSPLDYFHIYLIGVL